MSDSDPLDAPDEGMDDLFGDDAGDDAPSEGGNVLSDKDLASDQDGDLEPRDEDDDQRGEVREKVIYGIEMYRHRIPKAVDGNIQSLRVPKFLKFVPTEYDSATFEPTEFDIENAREVPPKPCIRFRRDAATGELKSNTVIYKWDDGSLTMSIGGEHFQINRKPLSTPADKNYRETDDAHYYAAAAHLHSNLLVVVGHVAEQLTIKPPKDVKDDALARLSERMAAATRGAHGDGEGMTIIKTTQDPELQKKQAELAEKERAKAQRRRENAAARMDGIGRYGGRSGGLSVGDLEGGRRAGTGAGRKRGAPGAAKPKRRRPEYDSDDDLPQGARRQDEYDMEDDFIVGSDEEEEEGEDDSEEEEILDDDDEEEAPRHKRQRTAERDEEDADAEADLDDDVPATTEQSRSRRRHVVDDDDEE